jgi:hypothetical protein
VLKNPLLDHGFQEENALEGHHVKGQKSIMDSKRYSLDGRNTLLKEHMSRIVIGVGGQDLIALSKISPYQLPDLSHKRLSLQLEAYLHRHIKAWG